jgi:hypothetical protein
MNIEGDRITPARDIVLGPRAAAVLLVAFAFYAGESVFFFKWFFGLHADDWALRPIPRMIQRLNLVDRANVRAAGCSYVFQGAGASVPRFRRLPLFSGIRACRWDLRGKPFTAAAKPRSTELASLQSEPDPTMSDKILGVILVSAAAIVLALGTAGAQIAYAISEAGFHIGKITGVAPPTGQNVYPHWLVLAAALVLGAVGSVFLFRRDDPPQ